MNTIYMRTSSTVTIVLIAICIAMFGLETYLGGSEDVNVLIHLGAKYNPGIENGEYWRFFMPMFLHIGIIHLVFNLFSLWMLGRHAERIYGHLRFFLIFFASGVSGIAASWYFNPDAVSAGASTSIYGIMGAILILLIVRRTDPYMRGIARSFIPMAIINIAYNFIPGFGIGGHSMDVAGHFGGLACGLLLGLLLVQTRRNCPQGNRFYNQAITNRTHTSRFRDRGVVPIARGSYVGASKYYRNY